MRNYWLGRRKNRNYDFLAIVTNTTDPWRMGRISFMHITKSISGWAHAISLLKWHKPAEDGEIIKIKEIEGSYYWLAEE